MIKPIDILKAELVYARQDYRFWAKQEGRLTKDEAIQKAKAAERIKSLETAIAEFEKGMAHCTDCNASPLRCANCGKCVDCCHCDKMAMFTPNNS